MEEKIGLFPALPPEERREVEEYVRRRPHLRDAFEAVLRLDRALQQGRVLSDDPPRDEALAYVAVMHDVDAARLPPVLHEAVRRIERRVEADPTSHRRYTDLLRRRAELEAASDVDAQLQRLMPEQSPAGAGSRPPAGGSGHPVGLPTRSRLGRRRMRRLASAAVALAAVYALLFAGGRIMRPDTERLASFDRSELALEGYDEVRGPVGEGDLSSQTVRYVEALSHLRQAETSFLGLFPSYDADRLDAAAALLRQVIAEEPEESFLTGEAVYLLGKTQLARGNLAEARDLLARVAAMGGRRAGEAGRLLSTLDE
jgi:hypothetical protein